jgi:hypothetical protein
MKLWGTERWSPRSRVGKQSKQERSSYKYNIISISNILANTKLGFMVSVSFVFTKHFLIRISLNSINYLYYGTREEISLVTFARL